jgi:hypothetical protein
LKHYQASLIPTPCIYNTFSSPGSPGILALQQLGSLYTDALAAATTELVGKNDSFLLPILSSIASSKAQQTAFYRLYDGDIPSERAFLTTIPPALAYSTFLQAIQSCPFDVNKIGLKTGGVMFSDWIAVNKTRTYCVDLAHFGVPSDLSDLSLSIVVGDQVPIVVKPRNVEVNGTVLAFDADFPRNEEILEGMIVADLTQGIAADEGTLSEKTLATAFIQFDEPLVGVAIPPGKDDASCPRVGGSQV